MKLSQVHGALTLNGTTQYGDCPYFSDLHPAEFSICGIINMSSLASNNCVLNNIGGYLVWVAGGKLRLQVYNGVGYAQYAETTTSLSIDTIYKFVVTYSASTLTVRLYDEDNNLLETATATNTLSYALTNGLQIGIWATTYFAGQMARVRLLDTALSADESQQWVNGKEFPDNEIIRLDFKEGTGTTTKDSSENNKTFTLYNTTTWSELDEDKTDYIEWRSLQKTDVKSSYADSLAFNIKNYGNRLWKPTVYDEIKLTDDSDNKLFAGVIINVDSNLVSKYVERKIKCKDYSELMDKNLVVNTFESMTIAEIIDQINTDYMNSQFTTTNVIDADFNITKISFNYERPTKCIKELAELIGYDWYVDYDKDIHFFAKGQETAPFSITDTNMKAIKESLNINLDNSQLRNVVYVRGGEYEGTAREENQEADGEQLVFPLGSKYASAPTVSVNSVAQTVGIDNLNDFTSYDCLWDFNQKYIRFETAPTAGHVVEVSGTPLIPVLVKVSDSASIADFGEKEFKIIDKTIQDKQTARQRGQAELEAYRNGLTEGNFATYEDGLRSGQEITVTSDLLGIDEKYIIQKMSMKAKTPTDDKMIYNIDLVSQRTLGIVDFLIKMLTDDNKNIKIDSDEVLELVENIDEPLEIDEEITRDLGYEVFEDLEIEEQIRRDPWTVVWVLGPYFPTSDSDPKREGRLDISMYLY